MRFYLLEFFLDQIFLNFLLNGHFVNDGIEDNLFCFLVQLLEFVFIQGGQDQLSLFGMSGLESLLHSVDKLYHNIELVE